MKTNLLFGILLLLLISCGKDDYRNPDSYPHSISYDSSFSTLARPISISFNIANNRLYVANSSPSIVDYSVKIQAFNSNGLLMKTVVDFETFVMGHFDRYDPVDITFDENQNLLVLVRPLIKNTDNSWTAPTGFSILQFDETDRFVRELDFSDIDGESRPACIACFNQQIYVTNGISLKKINPGTKKYQNITLPVNDNATGTWPHLHTTDMEINSNGQIYFTGQLAINSDSVGCHLSSYNTTTNQLVQNSAKGWTWMCCAMFNNPGLFINSDDIIYLASFYKMSVEVYDKNGEFIIDCDTRTPPFEETRPIDVAYNDGRIFVADYQNNQIHIFKQE